MWTKWVLLRSVLGIRPGFSADLEPDPALYLNADPVPGTQTNADLYPGQTVPSQQVELTTGNKKEIIFLRVLRYLLKQTMNKVLQT